MKKQISILIAFMILFTFTSAGCSKTTSGGEEAARDILRVAYSEEPQTLDPHMSTTNIVERYCHNIFDTLVTFDKSFNIVPNLAESWSISEDGLSYQFKLREDVIFHDDKKMIAEDVKYSFNRVKSSEYTSYLLDSIESMEVIDDYNLKVKLKYPYAPFLNTLTTSILGITNEEAVKNAGDDFANKPIGTGAYKVVEWKKGEVIIFERHDGYFKGKAPIKTVEAYTIADSSTKAIALENGEIDVAFDIDTVDRQAMMNNDALAYYETPSTAYSALVFNLQMEPFNNKLVRQAVSYAINKDKIIDILKEGVAEKTKTSISEFVKGYTDDIKDYEFDLEKSKQLLAEAGYGDGFNVTFSANNDTSRKFAEAIQSDLRQIGINLDIDVVEPASFYEMVLKGSHQVVLAGWSDTMLDADSVLYYRFHSDGIPILCNIGWCDDKTINDLIEQAKAETNEGTRIEMYQKILKLAAEEALEVPLFFNLANVAADKNLKGVEANTIRVNYFRDFSW